MLEGTSFKEELRSEGSKPEKTTERVRVSEKIPGLFKEKEFMKGCGHSNITLGNSPVIIIRENLRVYDKLLA